MCNYLLYIQSFLKNIAKPLAVNYTEIMGTNFSCRKQELISSARKEFIFERKDFMQFKIMGKSLIPTDFSHKITRGENLYDEVEIIMPRYHDGIDNSLLSHRLTVVSENGSKSAAIILSLKNCTEENMILTGRLNEYFSSVTGNVTFILTCIDADSVVGKFSSIPFTVNDDPTLASLPDSSIAEQFLNLTQLEAEKAIKASQTPAPAEIYPASETNLGGVKVDGKTITADTDGTVSVSDTFANMEVQIAHPNNFLIYDNLGKPSVMVAISKFYLDEIIDGAPHKVHPAFIVNGVEIDKIYISKYQNVVENNRAYSLPMKDPKTNITLDQAWNYCKNKGAGWHLITNAEWAAVALWCKKNGTIPRGNNDCGKDVRENIRKALPSSYDSSGNVSRTATGSGPASWYHDGSFAGISDFNGNIWEWVSSMRLVGNEIQVLENNNAADFNNSIAADSNLWKAVLSDGTLVDPGTADTLKYSTAWSNTKFSDIFTTPAAENNGTFMLESLGIIPHSFSTPADYDNNAVWISSINGEKLPRRGATSADKSNAGVFSIAISALRGTYTSSTGFRSAYYEPITAAASN